MKSPFKKSFSALFSALASVGVSHGASVIYEGFNYAPGTLAGSGGTTEVGLTGTWTANDTAISSGTLSFGGVSASGNSLGPTNPSRNRFMGARSIAPGALSGLLNDGSTLWFSTIMGYGAGGNRTNSRLAFSLGDSGFTGGNFDYDLNSGTGLGVTIGRFSGTNGKVVATQFTTVAGNSGFANNVFDPNNGSISPTFPGSNANTDATMVIGRITWGAASDTIDLFLPEYTGTNFSLGSVHSSLTVNVDQSGYDTISMQRGDVMVMDEIRFGATLADVIPEPSSAVLVAFGSLVLLRRRK